jgi:hypothetical protein
MKVAVGAAVMGELSKYPHAAEIIIPTIRPSTTEHDFINGLPNRSIMIIVIHTLNPNPMNSAEPHGRACFPLLYGQSMKSPLVGRP